MMCNLSDKTKERLKELHDKGYEKYPQGVDDRGRNKWFEKQCKKMKIDYKQWLLYRCDMLGIIGIEVD